MFIVLFLLITLPFTCTMYSMEQQSSELLKWDINGSEFYNYAALIRSNPTCPPIQSADKNTAIHQPVIQKPLVNNNIQLSDVELNEKFETFIQEYNQVPEKTPCLQEFLDSLPNKKDQIKAVEMFLTYQLVSLNLNRTSTIIKNLLTQYQAHFPVDTFSWNTNGDKALHLAVRNNKLAFAEYLICNLSASNNILNDKQQTPLTLLEELGPPNYNSFVELLQIPKNASTPKKKMY